MGAYMYFFHWPCSQDLQGSLVLSGDFLGSWQDWAVFRAWSWEKERWPCLSCCVTLGKWLSPNEANGFISFIKWGGC